ncbi:hypothetical protein DOE76_13015 [Leifsonia sp. ku-ls]|nr:hypothetical protein DOE76_13015 [Leifsonia sp. ku-ls]
MLVVLGYTVSIVAGIIVELATHSGWGVVVSSGIVLAFVVVLSRLFRGGNESDEPRSWWRMTAYPTAGYVLAGWFLLQAVGTMTSSVVAAAPAGWVCGVVSLVLALAYLVSAVRLTATGRSRNPARA